ncbi:MAG: hypothetical protein ACYTEX_27945 [Planctomycetota bacterium]
MIWVDGSDMSFRGSAQQGQALTACSDANFTDFHTWEYDKVGKFIYPKSEIGGSTDAAYNNMEMKCTISPDEIISDVEWDIRRETSAAQWAGTDPRSRNVLKGATDWAGDDAGNSDEDRTQNTGCKEIFVIDGPGAEGLPYLTGYKYSLKGKYREWVQVKIGSKWFVCSPYKEWRCIIHVKYKDATNGWVYDTSSTNEIVLGTISGFAGSWSEF